MLKLTETELTEMGFSRRTTFRMEFYQYGKASTFAYTPERGEVFVADNKDGDVVEAYPQTKEDLLTLIRLFTPPQEVKDVS